MAELTLNAELARECKSVRVKDKKATVIPKKNSDSAIPPGQSEIYSSKVAPLLRHDNRIDDVDDAV